MVVVVEVATRKEVDVVVIEAVAKREAMDVNIVVVEVEAVGVAVVEEVAVDAKMRR